MSKLELVGVAARRERQDLMTETDAEDRALLGHHAPHVLDRRDARLRIAGAVGDHHAVEALLREIVVPGHPNHRDPATHQAPDDTVLAATVDQHYSSRAGSVDHGILGADKRHEVVLIGVPELDVFAVDDLAEHHPAFAEAFGQRARVDAREPWDPLLLEPPAEALDRAPVAVLFYSLGDNESGDLDLRRLERLVELVGQAALGHSVVADDRVRQHQNLTA